jgi:hypothetical protein
MGNKDSELSYKVETQCKASPLTFFIADNELFKYS